MLYWPFEWGALAWIGGGNSFTYQQVSLLTTVVDYNGGDNGQNIGQISVEMLRKFVMLLPHKAYANSPIDPISRYDWHDLMQIRCSIHFDCRTHIVWLWYPSDIRLLSSQLVVTLARRSNGLRWQKKALVLSSAVLSSIFSSTPDVFVYVCFNWQGRLVATNGIE